MTVGVGPIQIGEADSSKISNVQPCARKVYAVRVKKILGSSGQGTISFNPNGAGSLAVEGPIEYWSSQPWEELWITNCIVEYSTTPGARLRVPPAWFASQSIANNGVRRLIVQGNASVGPNPDGSFFPIGGQDSTGTVYTPCVVNGDGSLAVAGRIGGGAGAVTTIDVDATGRLVVAGDVADGAAWSNKALITGGKDNAGNVRTLITDLDGALQIGNPRRATYIVTGQFAPTTATFDLVVIEAPAGLCVRVQEIWITNPGSATAAALRVWNLQRTTTAGAAGVGSAAVVDPADGAFGGVIRTGNGVAGALGAIVDQFEVFIPAAVAQFNATKIYEATNTKVKPVRIAPGTANGITLRDVTGGAGSANVGVTVVFTAETN